MDADIDTLLAVLRGASSEAVDEGWARARAYHLIYDTELANLRGITLTPSLTPTLTPTSTSTSTKVPRPRATSTPTEPTSTITPTPTATCEPGNFFDPFQQRCRPPDPPDTPIPVPTNTDTPRPPYP